MRSLPAFEIQTEVDGNYGHLGATLADAVLQSNNNYERNVRHRIARIRSEYASYVNLTDLQRLLKTVTIQKFLGWNGTRKPQTFRDLVNLLALKGIDTERDLKSWLQLPGTRTMVLVIPFVGPKTADYLKILVGLPVAAMDRHLLGFLEEAGLGKLGYAPGQEVVHQAADIMGIDRSRLDHSIWRYMSGREANSRPAQPNSRNGAHGPGVPLMLQQQPLSDGQCRAAYRRRQRE